MDGEIQVGREYSMVQSIKSCAVLWPKRLGVIHLAFPRISRRRVLTLCLDVFSTFVSDLVLQHPAYMIQHAEHD